MPWKIVRGYTLQRNAMTTFLHIPDRHNWQPAVLIAVVTSPVTSGYTALVTPKQDMCQSFRDVSQSETGIGIDHGIMKFIPR